MATWPANGVEDWNTKMLAYLAIEHNTDGTHAIKWPVNGTGTRIFTKYFTGTTDADSQTLVAHGIAVGLTKILHVSGGIVTSSGVSMLVDDYASTDVTDRGFALSFDNTNVAFSGVKANQQSKAYIIKIDYIA